MNGRLGSGRSRQFRFKIEVCVDVYVSHQSETPAPCTSVVRDTDIACYCERRVHEQDRCGADAGQMHGVQVRENPLGNRDLKQWQ